MVDMRIKLALVWIALMLVYFLGDVLRIFAGDFKAGEMNGQPVSQAMWMIAALIMLVPIVMAMLCVLIEPQPVIRWACLIAAAGLFLFNVVGLPGYPGLYDKFLIVVGLGINLLTIWLAWGWI